MSVSYPPPATNIAALTMKLAEIVATSDAVAATRSRNNKRDALASCLQAMETSEVRAGTAYLAGELPQGRIGVGPAMLRKVAGATAPATTAKIELAEVVSAFEMVASASGRGSAAARTERLAALFTRATAPEQSFLIRLLVGELRQGALDGVMVEAIASAWVLPAAEVRRAYMLLGDVSHVADIAAAKGAAGLADVRLTVGVPVKSMLAQPAEGLADALTGEGPRLFDLKMDGARVQVHKEGNDVAVFSRRLNEVTSSVPEVVEAARRIDRRNLVLDGEVIALADGDRPHPFQTTMRRFGRVNDVAAMRGELPLSVFFFDCIHVDGQDLLDVPLSARLEHLDLAVAGSERMPRIETADQTLAARFMADAFAGGHEGVMAKDPASPYEAGNRGRAWLKLKQAHTLDLVVLGAEWGSGRRRGFLSNLHLGAWDAATSTFVMLGKTFKGLTDKTLEWQTRALLDLEVSRDAHTVYVEPRLVVEIAFNDVQASPHYPGGVALRFARVRGYRTDKSAADADSFMAVQALAPDNLHSVGF